jgi:hypothetical protein
MSATSERPKLFVSARASFDRHHDRLSVTRQRTIANLACYVNVGNVALYLLAISEWDWRVSAPPAVVGVVVFLLTCSFLGMLAASSFPNAVARHVGDLGERPAYEAAEEWPWLAKARKYLFYPAAYLNFITVAIWIEVSGGLVHSPYTSVLFAMVLGAQQLSRFTLNSGLFIGFGVVATGLLALYETFFGVRDAPEAPAQLDFYILALSFLVTALCTHAAKGKNYRAAGTYPKPSYVELYLAPDGHWRFSLLYKGTRLDPRLEGSSEHETISEAKKRAEAILLDLCEKGCLVEWRTSHRGDEAVGYVRDG